MMGACQLGGPGPLGEPDPFAAMEMAEGSKETR